jgi:alanine racemase
MDSVTAELGATRASELAGERVVLIGSQGSERITAEEVAARMRTINYEVSCGLTPRVRRNYHRDGAPVGGPSADPSEPVAP